MLLDSHTHIVPFQFQMLLWDSIDAFYFGGGYVSAGLQNLLVSRHWHLFFFSLSASLFTPAIQHELVAGVQLQGVDNGHHNHHNMDNLIYRFS